MDVEQLHIVLQQSFSPDGNLRVPAEETIRNLKHVPGATTLLLQVAGEKQVSFFIGGEGGGTQPFVRVYPDGEFFICGTFSERKSARIVASLCFVIFNSY
jgi:hypothetical protein